MPFKHRSDKRRYQREWKRQRYEEARVMLGTWCRRCRQTFIVQIDHIDNTAKSYRITDVVSRKASVRFAELAKCQLLCEDCHDVKTAEEDCPF